MPSSKGKPTDPELYEKLKKEVQNKTNKDGSGKGQWSAWKPVLVVGEADSIQSAELSKEYEKQGGDYENEPGSKNEPKKGAPQEKPGKKRQREVKESEQEADGDGSGGEDEAVKKGSGKKARAGKKDDAKEAKASTKGGAKGSKEKKDEKDTQKEKPTKKLARPKKGDAKPTEKVPREGTRKSTRIQEAEDNGGRTRKQKTDYLHF
ncbi:hypothetical protein SLS58_007573 [Diplodia intermedia]|uniref:Uncharacterized protein n=1 Tax=Diplodia intermedia TaxID=856260 RepID=A0ABR3TJV9_9PEZI